MASESYIERLQRERKLLIAAVKAIKAWKEAIEWTRITAKKGDAFRAADEAEIRMNDAIKTIEPLLAEGDK